MPLNDFQKSCKLLCKRNRRRKRKEEKLRTTRLNRRLGKKLDDSPALKPDGYNIT